MGYPNIIRGYYHTQKGYYHNYGLKTSLWGILFFFWLHIRPRIWGILISGQKYKAMDWFIAAGAKNRSRDDFFQKIHRFLP